MGEQDPEKKYPHRAVLYINTHKSNITKNTNPHVVALKELLVQQPSLADTSHGKECLDEPLSASKDLHPTMNQKVNLLDELNSTMADEIEHDGYEELQAQCQKSKIQEKSKPPMPRRGLQGGRVSTSLNVKNSSNAAKVMNQDTARNSSNHEPYKNKGSLENYLPSTKDDQSRSKRKVGSHIFLKSWRNQNKKVALGTIIGCDPKQQVGGDPLGKEFWKVCLGLVFVRDEPLIRPYNNFVVLGDINNDPIAWYSSCVSSFNSLIKSYTILQTTALD
ncbi:hypothetical protein ZEAMMB73_Zm00001d050922 [Zea mays]|nr:hypothetical protein ZEAMMB73_Zm00001d050922 [Zea mays]